MSILKIEEMAISFANFTLIHKSSTFTFTYRKQGTCTCTCTCTLLRIDHNHLRINYHKKFIELKYTKKYMLHTFVALIFVIKQR